MNTLDQVFARATHPNSTTNEIIQAVQEWGQIKERLAATPEKVEKPPEDAVKDNPDNESG